MEHNSNLHWPATRLIANKKQKGDVSLFIYVSTWTMCPNGQISEMFVFFMNEYYNITNKITGFQTLKDNLEDIPFMCFFQEVVV